MHTHKHTHKHTHTHTHKHTQLYKLTHTFKHTKTHSHTHLLTLIYTFIQTNALTGQEFIKLISWQYKRHTTLLQLEIKKWKYFNKLPNYSFYPLKKGVR